MKQLTVLVLVALLGGFVESKGPYTACQLKKELYTYLRKPLPTTMTRMINRARLSSNFDCTKIDKDNEKKWKTYGIFQFPQPICDGQDPKLSCCGNDCLKFTNYDLSDDIDCVNTITKVFLTNPSGAHKVIQDAFVSLYTPYNCEPGDPNNCCSDSDYP